MRIVLGAILALMLATPALADDWWLFEAQGPNTAFIDLGGVGRLPTGNRTLPVRRFDADTTSNWRGTPVFEFAETWEIDCTGGQARPIHSRVFDLNGAQLIDTDIPHAADQPGWVPGTAGTNVGELVAIVCRNDRSHIRDIPASDAATLRALVRSRGGTDS